MKTKMRKGFTLVEILIVVIILGILAAIVIPQFTEASTQANESRLKTDLQTLRSQVSLFHARNPGDTPDTTDADSFAGDLELNGSLPNNPFTNANTLASGSNSDAHGAPGADGGGWYYNTWDNTIYANDNLSDPDGVAHCSVDYGG
jgi:general secretion pathway protein G